MIRTRKKMVLFGCVVCLILVLGVGYSFIMPGKDHHRVWSGADDQNSHTDPNRDTIPSSQVQDPVSGKEKLKGRNISIEAQLVKELKTFYGKTIFNKGTQASIYNLRDSFAGPKPDGLAFFHRVLKIAFPEAFEDIMETLKKLDLYNQWLRENEEMLSQMSDDSRLAALWEKRVALFGEKDALEIWEDDMLATDARELRFKDTIDYINTSKDMTLDDRLAIYRDSLAEIYEESPEAYLLGQSKTMTKVFFTIDSVQDELSRMEPDDRQMAINSIRRELGYSERQVELLEADDARRNARWENGLQYMEEREQLVSEFKGDALKEKLTQLRQKYFKQEAKTIELEEEKDGFFRYYRTRYYGRN